MTLGTLAILAVICRELEWLERGWVTWLAALVIVHVWLAYGWRLNALEWADAYDRDMSLCQRLRWQPSQSQQSSRKRLPKTDFGDQVPVRLPAFAARTPAIRVGLPHLDTPTDNAPQRTHGTHTSLFDSQSVIPSGAIDRNLAGSCLPEASQPDLIRPRYKIHTESEATPNFSRGMRTQPSGTDPQ